jgi:hypothetical protein
MQAAAPENARRVEKPSPETQGTFRRYRAIIIGTLLVPVNIFLLLYMEIGSRSTTGGAGPYPSTISLFANTILFLVVLTALNGLYARRFNRPGLDKGELLVIYVMLTISTAIVSIDFLDVLVPMMSYPFRAATPENEWAAKILPHISPWISVSDPEALKGWYEGHSTLYTWEHVRPWLVPVSVWSGVIFVMLSVMFCINTILRRQWVQNEKLLFPIVELPLQITEQGSRLARSRLLWLGFGIAGGISILNGLQVLYPTLPSIPVKMRDLSPFMATRPWNAIGWTPVSFYPYAIGFGFLLPVDMLFSCWFFFIMWRVVRILGAVYGAYDVTPKFPFMDQQALGAYYIVAVFALWSGRKHLKEVFRAAWRGERTRDEADEPMGYRTAFLGLVLGTVALMWFFQFIGLSWWLAVVCVLLYFFLALAIAKMHAEFGPPAHDLHNMGPEAVLTGMMGTRAFTPGELTGLSWFWWFNRAYRSIPIAYQLDALKIGQRTNTPQRYMALAIGLASVVAVISGFWIYLHFGYQKGASVGMAGHVVWFAVEAFSQRLQAWIDNPTRPNVPHTLAIGWGMGFAYFLYFMKLRAGWWPFHPLGFAISTSYSIGTLWLPLMIAWGAKALILRFGGLRAYKVALDFFLGLLLGDFIVGCLWPIVGWIVGVPTYSFMQ